jgi:thiol-disulfide isomerase/thioredoxin
MLERLILLVVLAALAAAAVLLVRRLARGRFTQLQACAPTPVWDSLGLEPDGRPTLLTFSTPSCAACHLTQAPAVRLVQQELGSDAVRVISVDASRQPTVAQAFGVVTVPSTVVLGGGGHVLAVNHGFAPPDKLRVQLAASA